MSRIPALAALILAALPARAQVHGEAALCVPGAERPALLVEVTGLKDRAGELRVELYPDTDPEFLGDKEKLLREGKTFRRIIFPVPASGHPLACLGVPAPGRYALAVIHDRAAARKFAFRRDGIGFPGDPHLFLGQPPASKAWITVGPGVNRLKVRLQYYDGFLGAGPVRKPVDDR